jgi:hypothetical protein
MDPRQLAFPRQLPDRHATEVGGDYLLRALLLPWRELTRDRLRHWPHAFIGPCDMHPDRQQDVVDKQRVSLVGMAEGGQQQAPEGGNRDVVDAHAGLIAQIANSRRVGLVSDRVQRRTRQIKYQRVMGLFRGEWWDLALGHRDNSRQPASRTRTPVGHPPNI